jgi:hypothetical protein
LPGAYDNVVSLSTPEHLRLQDPSGTSPVPPWRKWGPYLSERSWGSVREDYSANGEAWDYFTHDMARSKAYRWGEDGIAGISDRYQLLCFALAFWNGRDPILKERMFGVAHRDGNHGEDVKEYYFYLDSTPTHSYMKFLYKYPQAEYPYARLVEESRKRPVWASEFELLDTGIFDEDRYFDIQVEYAKAEAEDICIRIEVFNRGPEDAPIHMIPHLWFRNTWSWGPVAQPEPRITLGLRDPDHVSLIADDTGMEPIKRLPFKYVLGPRYLYAQPGGEALFTNNETNAAAVFGPGAQSRGDFYKDAFHRQIVQKERCTSLKPEGTKACVHYSEVMVPAGGSKVFRLRLTDLALKSPLDDVDSVIELRRKEADQFYTAIQPPEATEDEKRVQRQALAGLLWSKQIYIFDVHAWMDGDNPLWPPPPERKKIRNQHWLHLNSMRIMTMPDKWEYPWFAAWDLAFQCVPFALVDPDFAKEQLWLLLFEQFQHPNGQIPAYEWEFSDLNPPVHAWAVWRVYNMDRLRSEKPDRAFLEKCFHKLLVNFTWWVNKVDNEGNNVFEGGFLGLDNITVVDRSVKMPHGAKLEQSDATGWMGMFCLNMMRIALELAKENKAYEGMATKFFQHYVYIGAAMKHMGGRAYQLWDEEDGFFYDVLRYADGSFHKFRVRSLVGLIPLFAIERLEEDWLEPFPEFRSNLHWFLKNRQDVVQNCVTTLEHGGKKVHVLAIINPSQMARLIQRVADPDEFHSDFGLRSLSKFHQKHPFVFGASEVRYEPAESTSKLKGGNSNWRGPIWFPTTFMMIESIRKLRKAYGHNFTAESGHGPTNVELKGLARAFANNLIQLFVRNQKGIRPVHGQSKKFQEDPHWKDLILFYEYFNAETGEGLGASHQTGWTGLVASLIDEWRRG